MASSVAGIAATEKQVQAAKKEQKINRKVAGIERSRNIRKAIAERRIREAEIIQSSESQGTRSNSAVSGAVGAGRSDTASSIGFANTVFAGSDLAARTRLSGTIASGRLGTVANVFDTASRFTGGLNRNVKRPGTGVSPQGPYASGYKF